MSTTRGSHAFLAAIILLTAYFSFPALGADVRVYFSPRGGCTQVVVTEISKAKKTILFAAYNFTNTEILQALLAAKSRGVNIVALYDRSQKNDARTLADELGVTRLYSRNKIMHHKIIVIDDHTVLTGSFNWTANAERYNAENLVVIHDRTVAHQYIVEFERLTKAAAK
jgi:phosphatidylserine/phosphatidylglycerophosphate/cardiolipin synthase-like enzyme